MNFRATVKDGVIQVPEDVNLPDGTRVDVQPVASAHRRKPDRAFGIWKNRKDLGPEPVRTLRARARQRRSKR